MKLKNKYLSGSVAVLMTALILSGCASSEENKTQEEISISTEGNSLESSQGSEEEKDTVWSRREKSIAEMAEGEIVLKDEDFMVKMDELFTNFHKYIGREVSYEGFIYKLEDVEEDIFVVGRYYDISHGTHSHETVIGFEGLYDGIWPEVNTWVQVKGIIEERVLDGEVLPALRITEITEKAERGQEKVYD